MAMQIQVIESSHLLVWLWQFYKYGTKELNPEQLIVSHLLQIFPKIGSAGAAWPRGRYFFFRDWTAGDLKFKLQCRDLIACTGCVVAAYVVTND
jgi:hypothetical protein